jgi:hypothetical protein
MISTLAGHIHALGTGDARYQFHGKTEDIAVAQLADPFRVAVGQHHAGHSGTLLHQCNFGFCGWLDFQDQVGLLVKFAGAADDSYVLVAAVRVVTAGTGSAFQ